MDRIEFDINPVDHITTDAIGPPGKRVFYIQGWSSSQTSTVIVEKFQIQSLAIGAEQFLAELGEKFPQLNDAEGDYQEEKMHIHPPVDPLFRVGDLGLGYDQDNDRVVLVAREVLNDQRTEEEAGVVRYWCSRSQLRAMCLWGLEVVSRGRPLCPQCGEPMESEEEHFCPKKNGHYH
ncbi:MAG: DUF3090 domain-containing protein [Anaerolineales bacterium]|nr:DUF3090 domain-containing protein [Anaerolineales bacterium]